MTFRALLALAVAATLSGCEPDGSTPGTTGPCASPTGAPLGCTEFPIESAEDACWKLVECGAIPVANPEDDPGCCFDYVHCVDFLQDRPGELLDLSLACIEGSTCDSLKWAGSPDRPRRNPAEMPACLQHGDQP